jgi:hypothetical protein
VVRVRFMPARVVRSLLAASAIAFAVGSSCGPQLPAETSLGGNEVVPEPEPAVPPVHDASAAFPASNAAAVDAGAPDAASATPEAGASPDAAQPRPQADSGPALPTCDNSRGNPQSCARVRGPLGESCAFAEVVRTGCARMSELVEPRVAEELARCILSKDGTAAVCDYEAMQECVLRSVRAACVDRMTDSVCRAYFARCPSPREIGNPFTLEVCRSGLSSLKSAARRRVESCLLRSCDLEACAREFE